MRFFFHHLTKPSAENPDRTIWNEPSVGSLPGAFAESFLFGDGTTVLLGFNAVSTLIEWLGLPLFEELLESGSLRFAFAEAISTAYITSENLRALGMSTPGLAALYGQDPRLTTPYGRTLQELADQTSFPRTERKRLARLVQSHVDVVDRQLHNVAFQAARSDVAGSIGEELAFPSGVDPDSGDLPEPYLRQYLNVAGANVNVQMSALLGCDNLVADVITARVMQQRVSESLASIGVKSADYRTVLQIEDAPDLGRLLEGRDISFRQIVELGRTQEAEEFRTWIKGVEPGDSMAAAREYHKELISRATDSRATKSKKVIGYTGLGAIASLFDPTAGLVSGLALNAFDAFVFGALKQKWQPKAFMDMVKQLGGTEAP